MSLDPPDVDGTPPLLAGHPIQQLIAEETWSQGELSQLANVIWIRSQDRWHRLYFDLGIVYWRITNNTPMAYSMPERNFEVRLVDIGSRLGLAGVLLLDYEARAIVDGSEVEFRMVSGESIVFRNVCDRTTYSMRREQSAPE